MNLNETNAIKTGRRYGKRVGRGHGSGKGKTAGRGGKGQSARSGWHAKYYFEGGQMPLVRKLPKRGFSNFEFRKVYSTLNLRDLEGRDLSRPWDPERFLKEGLVNTIGDGVKILGEGELKGVVTIKAHRFSKSAMEKIKKAGGTFEWMDQQPKPKKRFVKKVAPKVEKAPKEDAGEGKKGKAAKADAAEGGKPKAPPKPRPEGGGPKGPKPEGKK
ncbi:MAG: 50S ribosomal protein L15 [Candidatus Brocadiae bacterium]|nr:50S ribosomal protein L15 [Candidatus Brocadiia bacterium]